MKSNAHPMVSVCIPTYWGATYLGATIESVLRQSYAYFEVLVIDDNSPDNTGALVNSYTDPRVRYFRNESNLGPEGNWNRGLELARGKYYKLLPQDDLLEYDCLATQVAVLEADTTAQISLVFGSRVIIDPRGRMFMTRGLPRRKAGRIDGCALVRNCIRAGANLIGEPGNGMIRREMATIVGPYDGTFPYVIDLDYWARVLLNGDAHYTASRASSFRISKGSWSVTIWARQAAEYAAFIEKIAADRRFGLSMTDRIAGHANARINSFGRRLVYCLLLRGCQ